MLSPTIILPVHFVALSFSQGQTQCFLSECYLIFLSLSKLHKSEILQITFLYLIDTHSVGMNTSIEILCVSIIARSEHVTPHARYS
jgi:hypothetical protein